MNPLVLVFAAIGLIISSLLGGLFLWLASKIARTAPVTFLRCWMAYLVALVVSGIFGSVARVVGDPRLPGLLLLALVCFVIQLMIVLMMLEAWHVRALTAFGAAVAAFCVLSNALSIPAELAIKEAARMVVARNNLKEIGLAMHERESAHKALPPAASCTETDARPLLSWRVALLPYIEQEALWKQFHLDEPWDSPRNKALLPKMPSVYRPVNRPTEEPYLTYYQVFVQADEPDEAGHPGRAPFSKRPAKRRGPSFTDFQDGMSQTILVVEGAEPVPWTKPDDLPYSGTAPLPKLGGEFKGGCNAVFGDLSVRWLPRHIGEEVLRALITCDGGEQVDLDDLQLR